MLDVEIGNANITNSSLLSDRLAAAVRLEDGETLPTSHRSVKPTAATELNTAKTANMIKNAMSELFDIEESKSPKLLWMEKHGIKTFDSKINYKPGDECSETGHQMYRWRAYVPTMGALPFETGFGDTEDEAITQLALRIGIKLWNEEGQP